MIDLGVSVSLNFGIPVSLWIERNFDSYFEGFKNGERVTPGVLAIFPGVLVTFCNFPNVKRSCPFFSNLIGESYLSDHD